MAWISYSFPQLSADDEARELAEMKQYEKLKIYKDKYGRDHPLLDPISTFQEDRTDESDDSDDNNDAPVVNVNDNNNGINNNGDTGSVANDDDISDELLDEFYEELDKVSLDFKVDYLTALVESPNVIENESNPNLFIRYYDYDVKKAAVGLCDYWKRRVEIFKDNSFKPMTLNGACKDIVEIMVQLPKFIRILPNDDSGRLVVCFDRTNVNYTAFSDHMVFVKYFWFVYHREMQKRSVEKNGVVFLLINRNGSNALKRRAIKYLVDTCLPKKVLCVHCCFSSVSSKLMLPTIKFFCSRYQRQRLELHLGLETPSVISRLKNFGLQSENLPISIGGTYDRKSSWVIECEQLIFRSRRKRHRSFLSSSSSTTTM